MFVPEQHPRLCLLVSGKGSREEKPTTSGWVSVKLKVKWCFFSWSVCLVTKGNALRRFGVHSEQRFEGKIDSFFRLVLLCFL